MIDRIATMIYCMKGWVIWCSGLLMVGLFCSCAGISGTSPKLAKRSEDPPPEWVRRVPLDTPDEEYYVGRGAHIGLLETDEGGTGRVVTCRTGSDGIPCESSCLKISKASASVFRMTTLFDFDVSGMEISSEFFRFSSWMKCKETKQNAQAKTFQ